MVRRSLAGLAAAAALSLACADDPKPSRYGCDQSGTAALTCVEYGPMAPADVDYARGYCASQGGTFLDNASCPAANRVASCQMPTSMGGSLQIWYAGYADLASVQAMCTGYGGTWTTY